VEYGRRDRGDRATRRQMRTNIIGRMPQYRIPSERGGPPSDGSPPGDRPGGSRHRRRSEDRRGRSGASGSWSLLWAGTFWPQSRPRPGRWGRARATIRPDRRAANAGSGRAVETRAPSNGVAQRDGDRAPGPARPIAGRSRLLQPIVPGPLSEGAPAPDRVRLDPPQTVGSPSGSRSRCAPLSVSVTATSGRATAGSTRRRGVHRVHTVRS
jgi:hypothetical protein